MKTNKNYLTYDTALIQYIEKKISLKNNTTYWVKVNNTLKRIAEIYFFFLKKQGVLLKERQKKNQCLAIIKSKKSKFFNSRCRNLTNANNDYCGTHKSIKKNFINNQEYLSKGISLFNLEGIEFLQKKVLNNSIDLILTDPPYLISKNSGFNRLFEKKNKLKDNLSKKYAFPSIFSCDSMFNLEQLELFVKEFYLKLKHGGTIIIFFDVWKITNLKLLLEKYNFKQIRLIEWIKNNPVPINSKINYLSNCREIALVAVKGKKSCFNSYYDKGIYNFPIENKNRCHPNQKNLELFKTLIKKHSTPNDLVLDSFLGSGTTLFACNDLGRNFIGCELEKKYFDLILDAIKK